MTLPAFAPSDPDEPQRLPHNLAAEQALLGILLFDNAAFERLPDGLGAAEFYEPFHQRMFEVMAAEVAKGLLAEPILLDERFKGDPAYQELGGIRYLADLVDRAPPSANASDYARVIIDRSRRRALVDVHGEGGRRAVQDMETPANELIESVEVQLHRLAERGSASTGFRPFSTTLTSALTMVADAYDHKGLMGLSTGLVDLDRQLGGLYPSDLIILAGRPSMGKTALATNIAFHAARHYAYEQLPDGSRRTVQGGIVAFFSLEMNGEQLSIRILADVAGVSSDRIRKGQFDASEYGRIRDAAIEIADAPLHIDDTGGLSIARLTARARRLKRRFGLDLIVVDYLQLVTAESQNRNDNRVQEVSAITQGLKALAKELNVPVLALSQLSRKVEDREDKRPQLADLRESGSIEQDADVVMFVYREAYYLGRAEPRAASPEHLAWADDMDRLKNQAEAIIGKARHGPIGTVKLAFDETLTRFGDLARDGRYGGVEP